MSLHVAPFSVLIAAIGPHWEPGCFEAVELMAETYWKQGYQVALYEEADLCYQPYDALGSMRNRALRRALEEGWEYLLYVDNDVLPKPDVLGHMVHAHGPGFPPVVAPILEYTSGKTWETVMVTKMERDKGIAMVSSVLLSMVLVRTRCFLPWVFSGFWEDAIGTTEDFHWEKLAQGTDIHPWVDTDVVVKVLKDPHFPLEPGKRPRDKVKEGNPLWVP
mgnify:CR=1 FL=1